MSLAIIIPYRNRWEHLNQFIPIVACMLRSEEQTFGIVVVEQADNKPFNRGKLLNVGVASLTEGFTHAVLHDVDMLPQESGTYALCEHPTHLAGAAEQFGHRLPYPEYFGGVTLFPLHDFHAVNGFNNDYWGWGCEDDDLLDRCIRNGLPVQRRGCRFRSLPHTNALASTTGQTNYGLNVARLRANRSNAPEYTDNGLNSLTVTSIHAKVEYFHMPGEPLVPFTHVRTEL